MPESISILYLSMTELILLMVFLFGNFIPQAYCLRREAFMPAYDLD